MKKRIISVALILSMICTLFAGCKKVEATTMRILRYEGKVILEEKGRSKTIKENIRLNSGNELETSYFSSATIGLDDVKIVSMDQKSLAEFVQSGKKLELKLERGSIFFEVQKPLEEDESFDIITSSMMMGIRGTSGYVEIDEDGNERLIVTDGVVHVIFTDPITGEVKEYTVGAGEEIRAFKDIDDYRAFYYAKDDDDDDDHAGGDDNGSGDAGVDDEVGADGENGEDDSNTDDVTNGDDTDIDDGNAEDNELYGDNVHYVLDDDSMVGVSKIKSNAFPAFARNYILSEDELKDKIADDMGEEELDEILYDEINGYELSPNSYGSYSAEIQNLINALEQLEMVFRIAAYSLNRDAQGLEPYLASKHVPGAQNITDWGMRILDSMTVRRLFLS